MAEAVGVGVGVAVSVDFWELRTNHPTMIRMATNPMPIQSLVRESGPAAAGAVPTAASAGSCVGGSESLSVGVTSGVSEDMRQG